MAGVERFFDVAGKLRWLKGKARDLYKDEEIGEASLVCFRVLENDGVWYSHLLPRHLASFQIGENRPAKNIQKLTVALPPFEQWQFVLTDLTGASADIFITQEVAGDRLLEAAILEGLVTLPAPNWTQYKQTILATITDLRYDLFGHG